MPLAFRNSKTSLPICRPGRTGCTVGQGRRSQRICCTIQSLVRCIVTLNAGIVCDDKKGQREGNYDSDRFQTRTLRYSLRRVSPLGSVNGGSHNPKVGGSNPPPATNPFNHLPAFAKYLRLDNLLLASNTPSLRSSESSLTSVSISGARFTKFQKGIAFVMTVAYSPPPSNSLMISSNSSRGKVGLLNGCAI
jgi:hypothetical protein